MYLGHFISLETAKTGRGILTIKRTCLDPKMHLAGGIAAGMVASSAPTSKTGFVGVPLLDSKKQLAGRIACCTLSHKMGSIFASQK